MTKEVKYRETLFSVQAPPHVGYYKLEIFAGRVPKSRGRTNLPIVATFMVEVRMDKKKMSNEIFPLKTDLKLGSIAEPLKNSAETGMYPEISFSPSNQMETKSLECSFPSILQRHKD